MNCWNLRQGSMAVAANSKAQAGRKCKTVSSQRHVPHSTRGIMKYTLRSHPIAFKLSSYICREGQCFENVLIRAFSSLSSKIRNIFPLPLHPAQCLAHSKHLTQESSFYCHYNHPLLATTKVQGIRQSLPGWQLVETLLCHLHRQVIQSSKETNARDWAPVMC